MRLKDLSKITLSLSVACWLSLSLQCSSASAMEITEQELNQLENNLTKLETINQQSLVKLITLKDQLKTSENQLLKLNEQLNQLKLQSTKQEELLATANESLKQYEKEMKAKLHRSKTTCNVILATLAIVLIKN